MFAHAVSPASRLSTDEALLRGAVMLTPHPRLARTAAAAFDAARRAEGAKLWQPPTILSWRAWTASLWRDALVSGIESRVLLNPLQERALWEQIARPGDAETLRSATSLAALCASATRLLGAYDLQSDFGRSTFRVASDAPDATTFARWWLTFEAQCRARGFLPASHAEHALAEHLYTSRIKPANEYLLHGFNTLTPAQLRVILELEANGATVLQLSPDQQATQPPVLAACASPQHELEQCAAWARHALEQPGARVAIVVPDLDACRPVLERALRQAIAPELADVTMTSADAPYEFSTGRPLATLPMVQDAMSLLRWCAGELSLDEAGAVLRSRSLALAVTPERGAEIDTFLLHDRGALRTRTPLRDRVSMGQVARWVEGTDPATAAMLRTLDAATRNLHPQRPTNHAALTDAVRSLLRLAGWPGTAPASDEHQAADRWDETLDRVASLDALGLRVTFAEFLDRLADEAAGTAFAPENSGAPLQVTTVAEATGRDVDALWFLHAEEATWPARQRPHPLLPIALQRVLHMPGTDTHADELAAGRELDHLLSTASSTVFSYALSAGETALRPSPLVLAQPGLTLTQREPLQHSGDPQLETIEDAAPLPCLPDGTVAGGVSVLVAQALCGFRAFAEKRLFSREMEAGTAGFTAGDRGDHVHHVLEAFWKATGEQQRLLAMTKALDSEGVSQRDRLLRECIDTEIPARSNDPWEESYLDVQRERLFRLLTAWLDFEALRPPFRVEELEKEVPDAAVGPLRLKLRVDRIDRVTLAGEEAAVLIDYKTGSAIHRKQEWMGDRLNEPQLPVYVLAGGIENIGGIAFGSVKVGRLGNKLEGIAEDGKMLSARAIANTDFAQQVETWRHDLTQLAIAFAEGWAAVDPKEYPKTCDRCPQRLLCRLNPDDLTGIDDMDEDDDEDGLPW